MTDVGTLEGTGIRDMIDTMSVAMMIGGSMIAGRESADGQHSASFGTWLF